MAKLTDLDKLISEALSSQNILKEAGRNLKKTIKTRTRRGEGVMENLGPKHKLPDLKVSTVRRRRKAKRDGTLTGPGATPEKSGLNRTGELLNSVSVKTTRKKLEVTVGKDQAEKVDELLAIDKKYTFMNVSNDEFEEALKTIEENLDVLIKKITITEL